MEIRIGRAEFADLFPIIECLKCAYDEFVFPVPPPEFPYAYHRMLEMINEGVVTVARANGQIVGVIAITPQNSWHNPKVTHLYANPFYVRKEFRKGGTAIQLAKKAIAYADKIGLPLALCFDSGPEPELKDRFAKMLGMKYMGGNFLWTPAETP